MLSADRFYKPLFFLTVFLFLSPLAAATAAAQETPKNERRSPANAFSFLKTRETTVIEKERKFLENLLNEKKPPEDPLADRRASTNQTGGGQTLYRGNRKERFDRYLRSVAGPGSLAKSFLSAGYSTWRNSPEEWGRQWEGFGRRVASNLGKKAISNTTRYALEEAFELDSRFHPSQKKDHGSRLLNAVTSPYTARNKYGKKVFGFPRVVGTFASSIIAAETWYPARYGFKDGLRSGMMSLTTNAAVNVFKEFVLKK